MTTINLYEDNAGQLYLHREGADVVLVHLEDVADSSTFAEDCEEYDLWAPEWAAGENGTVEAADFLAALDSQDERGVAKGDQTQWIATWDDGQTRIFAPHAAGRRYLGIITNDD